MTAVGATAQQFLWESDLGQKSLKPQELECGCMAARERPSRDGMVPEPKPFYVKLNLGPKQYCTL